MGRWAPTQLGRLCCAPALPAQLSRQCGPTGAQPDRHRPASRPYASLLAVKRLRTSAPSHSSTLVQYW